MYPSAVSLPWKQAVQPEQALDMTVEHQELIEGRPLSPAVPKSRQFAVEENKPIAQGHLFKRGRECRIVEKRFLQAVVMAKNRTGKSEYVGDPGHDDFEKPVDVTVESVGKPCGGNIVLGALQNRKQKFLLRKSSHWIKSGARARGKVSGPGGVDAGVEESVVPVVDPFQQNARQGLIQNLSAGRMGKLPNEYMKRGAPNALVLID